MFFYSVLQYKCKEIYILKELYRTNNPVEISYIRHEMAEHDIQIIELDHHTSIVEGSIGAIQRRIMVIDADFEDAKRILEDLSL